jgi:beta-galactosidase
MAAGATHRSIFRGALGGLALLVAGGASINAEEPPGPGELTAVAYKDGREIGRTSRRTAGPPPALRLMPDRTTIAADGQDLSCVLVEMIDGAGTVCPLANDRVTFRVAGPASIAGIEYGNPLSLEPVGDAQHALFHGKAVLVIRSRRGAGGEVAVTAEADGVTSATAIIATR